MAKGTLDIRKPPLQQRKGLELRERDRTDPYSVAWAKVVWPITRAILLLVAAVMLVPFAVLIWLDPPVRIAVPPGTPPDEVEAAIRAVAEVRAAQRLENMLDWAKTVLPSAVGFASAMIGYYFGTRNSQSAGPEGPPERPAEPDEESEPSSPEDHPLEQEPAEPSPPADEDAAKK